MVPVVMSFAPVMVTAYTVEVQRTGRSGLAVIRRNRDRLKFVGVEGSCILIQRNGNGRVGGSVVSIQRHRSS